jgi:thioredoxin-related protein
MKNAVLLLFFLSAQLTFAKGVNFHAGDFKSAIAKAEKEGKPLLVDAYTVWCGPCKMLDAQVFQDEEAAKYINDHFVSYKLDMEKGEGPLVAMKFRVQAYPSTLFISSGGKLISKEIGFPGKEGYLEWCKQVVNGDKRPFENLDARKLNVDFPDFYKYSFTSDQWKRARATAEQVNAYLAKQKDLTSEVNWSVIKAMDYTGHDYVRWAVKHADELSGKYPQDEIDDLRKRYIQVTVGSLKGDASVADMEARIHAVVDSIQPTDNSDIKENLLLNLYFTRKDYGKLLDFAHEVSEGNPSPGLLNSACWGIYEDEGAGKVLVERAIREMQQAIQEEPHPNYIDTLAHLYFKNGEMNSARQYAREALEKGKAQGMEMAETEKLLDKLEG